MSFVGRPSVDIGGGVPSLGLPQYDPLGDPHLHEYFTRRFSNIPKSRVCSYNPEYGGQLRVPLCMIESILQFITVYCKFIQPPTNM